MPNQKVEYDEEGNVIKKGINTLKAKIADGPSEKEVGGIDIERAREMLKAEDKFDKDLYRQKIKQKHTVWFFYGVIFWGLFFMIYF